MLMVNVSSPFLVEPGLINERSLRMLFSVGHDINRVDVQIEARKQGDNYAK